MHEPNGTTGYVYYLRVGHNIKIGYAADVKSRMAHYPPETELLAVEPGTLAVEASRLAEHAPSLVWGNEWFHPSTELKKRIADTRRIYGLPPAEMAHQYTPRNARPARTRLPDRQHVQAEEWMTVAESASELGVSRDTIRRMISRGDIEAHRIGPRLIRVKTESLRSIGRALQYVE